MSASAVVAAIVAVALVATGCALFGRSDTNGPEARRMVSEGARLVDVRSPDEFAKGHIEGAVNIPVGSISARLAEVGSKETPVVVYCRSGFRSARAAGLLRAAGFKSVHNLGAMGNW